MIIKKQQLEPFVQVSLKKFEDEMVAHLTDFSPSHAGMLKEDGLRKLIRLGMENSAKYGFTKKGPVRFYLEMMILFGSYFDTDFQYPWIKKMLEDDKIASQMFRADYLHLEMMKYFPKVIGESSEFAVEALSRSSNLKAEDFEESYSETDGDAFEKQIIKTMHQIYPEKASFLGDEILGLVVVEGLKLASRYQVDSLKGKLVFISMIYSSGHRFDIDPQFPWIKSTLMDDTGAFDPNKKADHLKRKMEVYVLKTLKNLL